MHTVQIQRVSGFPLEDMYKAYGVCLDRRGIPRNERRLFHGAAAAAVHNILQQGFRIVFNRCLCFPVFAGLRACVRECVRVCVCCVHAVEAKSVCVCALAYSDFVNNNWIACIRDSRGWITYNTAVAYPHHRNATHTHAHSRSVFGKGIYFAVSSEYSAQVQMRILIPQI